MNESEFVRRAGLTSNKKSNPLEKEIEKKFCRYASNLGCKAYKLASMGNRGFPDRTVICPGGRVFFIEFKRKGGKMSPNQIIMKNTLEALGFEYYVCDEKGQAELILDEFLFFG